MRRRATAWGRRCALHVIDTCAHWCFQAGLGMTGWRDRLEAPPPVSADFSTRILDRVKAQCAPPIVVPTIVPDYQPTPSEETAAAIVGQIGRTVYLLYKARTADPVFVTSNEPPCAYLGAQRS